MLPVTRKRYVLRPTYAALLEAGEWVELPNCPGRKRLAGGREATPQDLIGTSIPIIIHVVPTANDPVHLAVFDGGGLLSYARADGTWVHTLNTPEGLARKLAALGIELSETDSDAHR